MRQYAAELLRIQQIFTARFQGRFWSSHVWASYHGWIDRTTPTLERTQANHRSCWSIFRCLYVASFRDQRARGDCVIENWGICNHYGWVHWVERNDWVIFSSSATFTLPGLGDLTLFPANFSVAILQLVVFIFGRTRLHYIWTGIGLSYEALQMLL